MMPLIAVFVNHDGKIETTPESFSETMKKVYEAGVEDGKNMAFAQVYKEQWLPYKYITYPTYSPYVTPNYYATGDGDIDWSDMNVTCDTDKQK